jgi:putative membrane protein
MLSMMWLAAILAGAVHIVIFCMESLWWTTPQVRARFRQTPEQANATRLLALNQGFYNLFLALGTFAGLALVLTGQPRIGWTLVYWNCLFMLGAAVVLSGSAAEMRRGAFVQGAAPLVFLVVAAIRWAA